MKYVLPVATAVGTGATFLFGNWDMPLIAICVMMALDYITGVIKAVMKKDLSSEVGFKGLFRKLSIVVVLIVGDRKSVV